MRHGTVLTSIFLLAAAIAAACSFEPTVNVETGSDDPAGESTSDAGSPESVQRGTQAADPGRATPAGAAAK